MIIDTSNLNVYWVLIINAICTGLGVAIGTEIFNLLHRRVKKVRKKITKLKIKKS